MKVKLKHEVARILARDVIKTVRWQRVYIKKLRKLGASDREISLAVGLPEDHPAITEKT